MKKTLTIEGMTCGHCKARVEKALAALEGITGVSVDLEAKTAVVEMTEAIADDVLTEAVDDAGYDVISIA